MPLNICLNSVSSFAGMILFKSLKSYILSPESVFAVTIQTISAEESEIFFTFPMYSPVCSEAVSDIILIAFSVENTNC